MKQKKYVKILACFLAFVMILCNQVFVQAEEKESLIPTATISVGTVEAKAGSTVRVPIKISNNQLPTFHGAKLGISYDADVLEYISAKDVLFAPADENDGAITSYNENLTPGYIQVSYVGDKGVSASMGTLFTLTFRVNEDISVGTIANITLTISELFDVDMKDINIDSVEISNGSVAVPSSVDFVVSNVTAKSSQEDVTVPVMVKNNRSKIGAYTYIIHYDAELLTFTSVDRNDMSVEITNTPGEVKISAMHGKPISDSAAQLEVFHFNAKEVLADTDTVVSIEIEKVINDVDNDDIPIDSIVIKNGTVTILSKYDATIQVSDVEVEEGQETFSVPISIANNRLAIGAMTIKVTYDTEVMEYVVDSDAEERPSYLLGKFAEGLCTVNEQEPGVITIMYTSIDDGLTAKEGDLISLNFKTKAVAQTVNTTVSAVVSEIIDTNAQDFVDIELEYVNGTVNINANVNAAKEALIAKINEAFASYKEEDYSKENWAAIVEVKDAGLTAVEEAETIEAAEKAADDAIEAMANSYQLGDVDRDGDVDTDDVLLALQVASGEQEWNDNYLNEGDLNRDNKITAIDSLIILKKCVQQ